MPENPFDQLGLKKELAASLRRSNRLDDFLKSYYRLLQIGGIHPDKGGDNELCALVNNAYTEIRKKPEKIDYWIQNMQNGANPEHLKIIEVLVGEVEASRKLKDDYEKLKEQYAQVLSSKAGRVDVSEVKKAAPRARKVEPEAEPEVRRPKARRVSEPEIRETEEEEVITVEPITLADIILYDLKGKPAIAYKKATLDGEAIKGADGSYLTKTQDGWLAYYREKADGKVIPPLPLWYAMIERLQEEKNPALNGILKDLKENWLCTSTRLNYKKHLITHGYGFEPWEMKCKIPSGDHYLDEVKKDEAWREALQTLLMPKDLDRAIEVLNTFSGVKPYIWTPDKKDRKTTPERAVWLCADSGRLLLGAVCRPGVWGGRSRGVVLG